MSDKNGDHMEGEPVYQAAIPQAKLPAWNILAFLSNLSEKLKEWAH